MLQHSYNYTKRYTVIYLVQPRIYRTMIQSCKQSDFSTKAGKKKNPKTLMESIQLALFPGMQVKIPYS